MNTTDHLPLDQDPPEADVLAGEYVLGVLDAAQRRQVEARIAADPDFAAEVSSWENHFMALAEQVAPVNVPDYVWARISDALALAPAPRKVQAAPRDSFWNSLGFWRAVGVGGLATTAACVLALFTVLRTPETQAPSQPVAVVPVPVEAVPMMTSTLARDDGKTGYMASVDRSSGQMMVMPMDPMVEPGRVQELWLIPSDGTPRSLGIVSAEKALSMRVPEALRTLLEAGATLAITLEPPGGGPGGKPTGPITAKGALALL